MSDEVWGGGGLELNKYAIFRDLNHLVLFQDMTWNTVYFRGRNLGNFEYPRVKRREAALEHLNIMATGGEEGSSTE